MTIVEITGGMLRAARSLAGLSQQELAERASISRPCLTAWEGSSGSVPNAKARSGLRSILDLAFRRGLRVVRPRQWQGRSYCRRQLLANAAIAASRVGS